MSIPESVQQMIQQSETIRVEFKEQFTEDFPEHIMAFANCKGGHILVGVKGIVNADGSQNGQIVGFLSQNIDKDKQRVDSWAHMLQPAVTLLVNQEYSLPDGRWLLQIEIKEQTEKPVGTGRGKYTIRTHSGTRPMGHAAMRQAVFEESRALKSLMASLERNIVHAQRINASMLQGKLPVTVFEKAQIISAISAPDIYSKLNQSDLQAAYQACEIVDRLVGIKIILRPIQGNTPEIDGLIQNHAKEAIHRSNNLLGIIRKILQR